MMTKAINKHLSVKEAIRKKRLLISYAVKMIRMPAGTKFEVNGEKVGRMAYIVNTVKLLQQM